MVSIWRSRYYADINYWKVIFVNSGGEFFGFGFLFKGVNGTNAFIPYYLCNDWRWGAAHDHVGSMGWY